MGRVRGLFWNGRLRDCLHRGQGERLPWLVDVVIVRAQLFEQALRGAFGLELLDLGAVRDAAEHGVFDDLLDEGHGLGLGLRPRQVEAGDLQAIEQQPGAARIQIVGGDALQHLAERELQGGAVLGHAALEGAQAGLARGGVFHRAARSVVEVAEIFVAQADRAAAAAPGKDVTALEALRRLRLLAGI